MLPLEPATYMNEITLIGIGASIFTATAAIPQLIKIIRCKKGDDLSKPMLVVLLAGLALWVVYGLMKKDMIIAIANTIPFIVNLLILFLSFRYKKTQR